MTCLPPIVALSCLLVAWMATTAGAQWSLNKPLGDTGRPPYHHWCPTEGCWVFEGVVYGDYGLVPTEGDNRVPLTAAQSRQRGLQVDLLMDGQAVPGVLKAKGGFHWSPLDLGKPGTRRLRWRVSEPGGQGGGSRVQDGPENLIDVLPNVYVRIADVAFGVVAAGCGQEAHCQALDFGASTRLEAKPELSFSLAGETDLPLVLRHGDAAHGLSVGDEPVVLRYDGQPIQICAVPDKCAGFSETDQVMLHVVPADKRIADHDDGARRGRARLTAEVEADWLACNLWWILTLIGLVLLGLILYGLLKPYRFPPSATIQIHAKEAKLARSPAQILPNAPGGRRGFYRDAYCAFNAVGQLVKRREGPALVLHAAVGYQVRLELRGVTVERKSRGKWRVVDTTGKDTNGLHETHLQTGAVYRVGQAFFFRVSL